MNTIPLVVAVILTITNICKTETKFDEVRNCFLNAGIKPTNIIEYSSNPVEYDRLNFQVHINSGIVKPVAYMTPENAADVSAAVICGRRWNSSVVPKCGGHSYAKYSFGDDTKVIMDLEKLNEITIDTEAKQAVFGAGQQLRAIYWALWEEGELVAPLGLWPTVGISGLTLGGGYGHFSRLYGMALDSVLEMEMVDAAGAILQVNKDTNPDLFWALRGAGQISYGIVTQFTYKLYDAPKTVITGFLKYNYNDSFSPFFAAWQTLIAFDLPRSVSGEVELSLNTISLWLVEFQDEDTANTIAMEAWLNLFPTAVSRSIKNETFPEYIESFAGGPPEPEPEPEGLKHTEDPVPQWYLKPSSFLANKVLDAAEIDQLKLILMRPAQTRHAYLGTWGGAITDVTPQATAFVHRDPDLLYLLEVAYFQQYWDPVAAGQVRVEFENTKALFGHTESYQNTPDEDMENYLERYYGVNLQRLVEIKARTDPEDYFSYPQAIPTELKEEPTSTTIFPTTTEGGLTTTMDGGLTTTTDGGSTTTATGGALSFQSHIYSCLFLACLLLTIALSLF